MCFCNLYFPLRKFVFTDFFHFLYRNKRQRSILAHPNFTNHIKKSAPALLISRSPVLKERHPFPFIRPGNNQTSSIRSNHGLWRIKIKSPIHFTTDMPVKFSCFVIKISCAIIPIQKIIIRSDFPSVILVMLS